MSLWDVFKGKQSFVNWLTGRDPKESDVYNNPQKVDEVESRIKAIANTDVVNARSAIFEAFNQLNSVNGMADYVGTVQVDNYDSLFDSIKSSVNGLADQLRGKADSIKAYEESSVVEKIGSTATMAVCKVGEGLLSVVEDLGDGVLSLGGWVCGLVGADGGQDWCAQAIKKEWSHDAFNFYYNSEFAKKSAFTEDSAIAGTCKIAGKVVGYLYAGGAVAGIMQGLGAGATIGSGILSASTTTWGATVAGFVGGLGSGTETGLNAGLSYNSSFLKGVKTGAIQGGMAFVGGKIGEKMNKAASVKEAQKAVDQADEALNAAKADVTKFGDEMVNPEITDGMADLAKNSYEAALEAQAAATTKLEAAKSALDTAKSAAYQGYTDSITQAGVRFGETATGVVKDGLHVIGTSASATAARVTARGDPAKELAKGVSSKAQAASDARLAFKDSVKELAVENPFTQGFHAVKATGSTLVSNGVMGVPKAIGQAVVTGAKLQVQPSVLGVEVGTIVNNSVQNAGIEAASVLSNYQGVMDAPQSVPVSSPNVTIDPSAIQSPTTPSTPSTVSTPTNTTPSTTTTPSNGNYSYDGGYSYNGGGYSYDGGNTPGNNNDGGYTPPVTTTETMDSKPEQVPVQETNKTTEVPVAPIIKTNFTESEEPVTNTTPSRVTQTPTVTTSTQSKEQVVTPTVSHSTGQSGTSGGGYYATGGAVQPTATAAAVAASDDNVNEDLLNSDQLDLLDEVSEDSETSLSDIFKSGKKISKIPTSTSPIQKSKNSVIPIAAGLSVAAAAGLGAKAYMDYKKNNSTDEEEEYNDEYEDSYDDYDAENWIENENLEDEDTIQVDYDKEAVSAENPYAAGNDAYFQENESYTARGLDDLAEIS